jgi:cytochrome c556
MKKPVLRFATIALATIWSSANAVDNDEIIEYREGLMNVYAHNVSSMRDMIKGKTKYDCAAFSHHARELALAARLDLLSGFPAGSLDDESEAKSAIWVDWNTFQERYNSLRNHSSMLAKVAATCNQPAINKQLQATIKSCKECHNDFKE